MSSTEAAATPTAGTSITAQDTVGRILERYPQTMGVFSQFGITRLGDTAARQNLAGTSIEEATRKAGADLQGLLGALNRISAAVDGSGEATGVSLPITKNHTVGEVTEAYPATLQVFLQNGFAHLADENMRRTVARTVTIEMATKIHGIELNGFLDALNEAAGA